MKEKEIYTEIESLIKRNEINKKIRVLEENYDTLTNYWHIGKLLVEAQGGEKRAKYGLYEPFNYVNKSLYLLKI